MILVKWSRPYAFLLAQIQDRLDDLIPFVHANIKCISEFSVIHNWLLFYLSFCPIYTIVPHLFNIRIEHMFAF